MAGLGKHDTARKGPHPYIIAYIKGDRRLADCGKTLEDAKARIERRLAKRHNKGESAEVYYGGELIFSTTTTRQGRSLA